MKLAKGDSKFAKAFGKTQLVTHLEKAIAGPEFNWTYKYSPKQGDDGWHPSGHCTPSLRELYLIATEGDEDIKGMNKTFQVGHFWHQYLQEVALRAELCSKDAIERRGERRWGEGAYKYVTGSGDIAPCVLPSGKELLVDFKTMSSHAFRGNDPPMWAIDKWECQTNVYMDFFDLDEAIIVGINKDGPHDMKEFRYFRNQPLIDALYEKWRLVSQCIDESIEPPEDEEFELPLKGVAK